MPEPTPEESKKTGQTGAPIPLILLGAGLQLVFAFTIWAGLLFLSAGTSVWPRAWIHLGLWLATFAVNLAVLLRWNRDVLLARLRSKRSSQWADTILLLLFLLVTLAVPVVSGLDTVRFQWSLLPFWTVYAGIMIHAAGDALLLWTMVVNPFLEKTVRVQSERGHHVVTTGPYAIVRHPMYSGVVLMFLAIPLVFGSAWTFVPVIVMALLLMLRTELEERLLRQHLPGYEDYRNKIRWRMIPRVW